MRAAPIAMSMMSMAVTAGGDGTGGGRDRV